ncbi:hypothetical protein HIM_03256 [Hirsutella minnesotensis 3608]|nr:hypothetical protein HIM_03256 [Hirsutella minnesotensis 3608]
MSRPLYRQQSSNSSRSSFQAVHGVPIITQYGDAYNPGALPRGPLRVPRRQSRRSIDPGFYPPPYVSPEPYCESSPDPGAEHGNEREVSPTKESTFGSEDADPPKAHPRESTSEVDERPWFAQRKRSMQLLLIVGLVAIAIIALAVGLGIGLRRRQDTLQSIVNDSDAVFPAGSFAVKPRLTKTSTDCTSQASSWRCEPLRKGASILMYWEIQFLGPSAYAISARDNALTPAFSNISLALVDEHKPNERFIFSLPMNKVVTPSDASSPTSRAAKCLYPNVIVQAVLYTRRKGGQTVSKKGQRVRNSTWPGNIEVLQFMNSTIGQPTCEDKNGVVIADVQAGQGTCECLYGNQS